MPPALFFHAQNTLNSLAAGASPRTPLGSLQRSPRPPSRLGRGQASYPHPTPNRRRRRLVFVIHPNVPHHFLSPSAANGLSNIQFYVRIRYMTSTALQTWTLHCEFYSWHKLLWNWTVTFSSQAHKELLTVHDWSWKSVCISTSIYALRVYSWATKDQ